eukprot:CAMPEP_0119106110 /NCGR_PEP_ID=MMETSP1180-20130426/3897_1 /TAXON_ID=3052 ORGANISM="Chlamydomonas cf sp, Strain CCMP681" /NCGR_SAMPLE_ID=MMETSP1180 /ASSEMBLY_ACC=CAM_ASM_000741 /LENGTH=128 /DNA_ID=CAMNT_0007091359 /DNA_START=317 /DNA_END=700 /DNA_ORIENTATION=+
MPNNVSTDCDITTFNKKEQIFSPVVCMNWFEQHISREIHDLLCVTAHNLAEHDCGVAIQEGNAGQALTVLVRVHNQGLHGLEHHLSHLIGLQGVGVLCLLAAGLLTNLPVDVLDAACGATAAHEADGG